jgi:MFS family permease
MNTLVRMIIVAAVIPLAISLAAIIAILLALPELPDPVATHWNIAGEVDGTGPVWFAFIAVGLMPLAYSAFVLFLARPRPGEGITTVMRLMAATAPFLSAVLATTIGGSIVLQRGIATASDAPDIGWLVATGFGVGILLAIASWFVLPKGEAVQTDEHPVTAMSLGATEKAAWMQRIGPSRGAVAVLSVAVGVLVIAAAAMWALTSLPIALGFTAFVLLIVGLVASMLVWRVTVGAGGLRVRSTLGWPDVRVPLDEVASVSSVEVDPIRDFGGWGMRWGGNRRWGIITNKGEAIEVRRRNGSAFVVTVPAAGEGAALLASLAGRG